MSEYTLIKLNNLFNRIHIGVVVTSEAFLGVVCCGLLLLVCAAFIK